MSNSTPVCGSDTVVQTHVRSRSSALPRALRASDKNTDRWSILSQLVTAREAFGLKDRDITVLRALISCLPKNDPNGMFVFASNRTLSSRAEGMHERTLRRHLANLVNSGLISRHNSPNQKRYARRDRDGTIVRAFGFDLTPLWAQSDEICMIAQQVSDEAAQIDLLREELSLIRMRILMSECISEDMENAADAIRKLSRRKLSSNDLREIIANFRNRLPCPSYAEKNNPDTRILSARDSQNVRHNQSSTREIYKSEVTESNAGKTSRYQKRTKLRDKTSDNLKTIPIKASSQSAREFPRSQLVSPTLPALLKACPKSVKFSMEPIRTWRDLITFTDLLAPMLRIGPNLLEEARTAMGAIEAAVTVMCIIQMGDRVRSPGAYLRALSKRAATGAFSTGPMVRALLGAGHA